MRVIILLTLFVCGLLGTDRLQAQWRFELSVPDTFAARFQSILQKTPLLSAQFDGDAFVLTDSAAAANCARDLVLALHSDAWLAASVDSIRLRDSVFSGRLYPGPRLPFIRLDTDRASELFRRHGLPFRNLQKKSLPYPSVADFRLQCLAAAENNGYPFASVALTNPYWENNVAHAELKIDLQRFITFKGIKYKADFRIPKNYFERALHITPGQPYSREQVLAIVNRMRTIPFAQLRGNPTVSFAGGEATVNLFLQKKKAGRFDFVIGILPQSDSDDARLIVNGSLDAAFHNALGLGESVQLNIDRLRPETQKLDAQIRSPYLFGSPFGLDAALHIFKRDSTWVDALTQTGVDYLFSPGHSLTLFWENKSSFLQQIDTTALKAARRLPANLDYRRNTFGVAWKLTRVDYLYNPRSGWDLQGKINAGAREIKRNSQIENLRDGEFSFATLYDTVQTQLTQINAALRASYYLPLARRGVLLARVEGGALWSDGALFNNEAFRLGGNKRLRGFDEESLFATQWALFTAEARLITGENAYFSVFSDYAYLENRSGGVFYAQRPWGLGAGMNFETRNGVFGLTIAFGRRDPVPGFDWSAPKFHLGYVSLF